MIRAHALAVITAVDAEPNVTVYSDKVPNSPALPYVVVYGDSGGGTLDSLRHTSGWRTWRYQTTSVGSDRVQAQAVAEKVEYALLDRTLTVASRSCTPVRRESSQVLSRDDDVDPPVFTVVDVWTFSSTAA